MTDFSQILERERETKQANMQSPVLNDEKEKPQITENNKEKGEPENKETNKKKNRPSFKRMPRRSGNTILKNNVTNPVWLNVTEAAKIAGVQPKTIRRAIKLENTPIKFKIRMNRYLIDARSLLLYLHSRSKLKNKLYHNGLGQYIKKWKA